VNIEDQISGISKMLDRSELIQDAQACELLIAVYQSLRGIEATKKLMLDVQYQVELMQGIVEAMYPEPKRPADVV
jgi:hypothetical protein